MTSVRRLLAAVALVLLGATAAPAPARAEEPLSATTCSGVWVVVGSAVSCAPSHLTGETALESAGHALERGGGLVCRIDGVPESCRPTFDAYWSYWHAERLQDGTYAPWRYATTGAGAYAPRAGDAEGWAFGDGRTPPPVLPPARSHVPAAPGDPEPGDGQPVDNALAAAPTALTLASLVAGGSALAVAARRRGL